VLVARELGVMMNVLDMPIHTIMTMVKIAGAIAEKRNAPKASNTGTKGRR
jgi:hypothetical protein